MIARPRTITDADALALARAAIVEHGPGVSLATLSRSVGLSPPALIKRFGSKEQLLFQALLPATPPQWWERLAAEPGTDAQQVLQAVLLELCTSFEEVGPALAALRMSAIDVGKVFPADRPGPSVRVREQLADWLRRAGVSGDVHVLADAAVGAAEARGFLAWVGPQLIDDASHEAWAEALAGTLFRGL